MSQLYLLKCNAYNKYYIGNIEDENEWIKIYKPDEIMESINKNNYDNLNDIVIKYMKIYGIENVRGGSYDQVKLSDVTIKELNYKINKNVNSNNDQLNCEMGMLCDDMYNYISNPHNVVYNILSNCFGSLINLIDELDKEYPPNEDSLMNYII